MSDFKSACGASITEAHFYRNIARTLMGKTKGMTEAVKAQRVFMAREAMTQALMATPEGMALLLEQGGSTVGSELATLVTERKPVETPPVIAAKAMALLS